MAPMEALKANILGSLPLSPPTLVTLHELLPYEGLDQLMEDPRIFQWGDVRVPRLVSLSKGAVILLPSDPMYNDEEAKVSESCRRAQELLPGEPFSRLLLEKGIWRPITA